MQLWVSIKHVSLCHCKQKIKFFSAADFLRQTYGGRAALPPRAARGVLAFADAPLCAV